MKIQKLRLCNFSSYEGENQFDFSTDDDKTIILIGGQNGAGKTSLFTAIKIALYGPLAFGYTGMTSYYIKKIKDYINAKAFQDDVLYAFVSVDVAVKQEREMKIYSITRSWDTKEKKLTERYAIEENGRALRESERSYIENYIYAIIPPDLFDLFLFDGEAVGNIFATEHYHTYVKNALLTLCGIDVFSVIGKFCSSFVDKNTADTSEQLHEDYQNAQKDISALRKQMQADQELKSECLKEIAYHQAEIEACESKFVRAGGIPDMELKRMREEESEKEKKRVELAGVVKSFVETEMPFFIVRDMIKPIEQQLHQEEKFSIYEYIQNLITPVFLKRELEEKCESPEKLSETLHQSIMKQLRPNKQMDTVQYILDMSRDEISRIDRIIELVENVMPEELVNQIGLKNKYSADIAAIHQKLKNTLTEEEAQKYHFQMETAKARKEALQMEVDRLDSSIASAEAKLLIMQDKRDGFYRQILEQTQNRHIYQLSRSISEIMQKLVQKKTDRIRQQFADYTLKNLNQIYRKDNLISQIEVDKDFRFRLYQNQDFTLQELQALLSNVGSKAFLQQIGDTSIQQLIEHFQTQDSAEMIVELRAAYSFDGTFHLYQEIELNRLSKGERQIFILALYWAMVQVSGKEIPFVIDTPYARIDANHREEISKKFFPKISSQVLILSTDEEITEEYYHILKPYIAKEYLLSNNKGTNKTTIEERYFFEVNT